MNDAAQATRPPGLRAEYAVMALVGLLVLAAFGYVMSQRQQALRSSPAGFDGLQSWLSAGGIAAQSFTGGWQMDQNGIGLLLVPFFDTRFDRRRTAPKTKEELLFQQDEYDLVSRSLFEKARRAPTLVVLPKWRSGMRLTGLGHPALLVEQTRAEALMRKMTGNARARMRYGKAPFTDFGYQASDGKQMRAQIYAAQVFDGAGCTPVVGTVGAMLLGDCPLAGSDGKTRLLILSDPDLLNNHGLRLGQNALIARDFLGARAGNRNLVIDYSRDMWLTDPRASTPRERSWADLLAFFGPPFTLLWLGAALVFGLTLWRAARRFGPIRSENRAPGASKAFALRARARLLRLSGQDGAMVGEYASARIAALASRLFGPARAMHYANDAAFLRYAKRRHPGQAAQLENVLTGLRDLPARIPASDAMRYVDELERVLEHIANDT